MSKVPSNSAWRRTSSAVKWVERQRGLPGSAMWALEQGAVFAKITESVDGGDEGEYKAVQVQWASPTGAAPYDWVEVPVSEGGRIWDDADDDSVGHLQEINKTTGIAVDTIVLVYLRGQVDLSAVSTDPNSHKWFFQIGGGSDTIPVLIQGKVEPANNPDEDRWYCDVYPQGKHGDVLDPPSLPDDHPNAPGDAVHVLYILTIDTGVTLPAGQIWLLATRKPDVDDTIDVPHEDTPGYHYEGQIPLWFCEP